MQTRSRFVVSVLVALASFGLVRHGLGVALPPQDEKAKSVAAFRDVARLLRHPRCLNCHPSGDAPHVGELRKRHAMNVQRGEDGHGVPAMRCSTCHRDENQDAVGLPGAPHWHLAPRSMGWENLDDHDLAEALKDPNKNGNRSLADIVEHMEKDPLVGWAWDPGKGRSAPPISREETIRKLRIWIETGAVSPEPGMTSTF